MVINTKDNVIIGSALITDPEYPLIAIAFSEKGTKTRIRCNNIPNKQQQPNQTIFFF